jgi:hypothetical protein
MDIAGAKALKKRLGSKAAEKRVEPTPAGDISEDAPPVYHWTGVQPDEPSQGGSDDAPVDKAVSMFRRLAANFR